MGAAAGSRDDVEGDLGGGGSTRRRLTSLLLRLRVPVAMWLPLLHGFRAIQDELSTVRDDVSILAIGTAAIGSDRTRRVRTHKLHALAPWAFLLLSLRALLSDGTMALLVLQIICSGLSIRSLPPLAAALPLLSAVACLSTLRALAAALLAAATSLLRILVAAALVSAIGAAVAAHALPVACGDSGGPYACTDGVDCFTAVVDAAVHAAGLREECAHAVSVSNSSWIPPSKDRAAVEDGAWALPVYQLSLSLALPLLLLAWAFATIRTAIAQSPNGGLAAAPHTRHLRCFLSGRAREGGVSEEEGGRSGDGGALLSGVGEHSPWHYCAFVCRILGTPSYARTPMERHAARCLLEGSGIEWLPYAGNQLVTLDGSQPRRADAASGVTYVPLALSGP